MKKTYHTPEIHCQGCAGLISDTLDELAGVNSVHVDVAQKTVTVDYGDASSEPRAIEMLKQEGYSAHPL